ncbi:MAG: signal peptidase I, partial [Pseudomonadota bacterium]
DRGDLRRAFSGEELTASRSVSLSFHLPFAAFLRPFEGRVWSAEPERGDIIVFKLPSKPSTDYIKRIVGLPGDTIQVRNGRLYLNDSQVPRTFKGEVLEFTSGFRVPRELYTEDLPGAKPYAIHEQGPGEPLDNTRVFNVPAGHYFVMGDNRDGSQDSRVFSSVGYIPAENIVGRAERIFYSVKEGEPWWQFWRWGEVLRTGRTFMSVYAEPDI